jgi:hypothetical protein
MKSGFILRQPNPADENRIKASTSTNINHFFDTFTEVLSSIHPSLLYNFDEISLTNRKMKKKN